MKIIAPVGSQGAVVVQAELEERVLCQKRTIHLIRQSTRVALAKSTLSFSKIALLFTYTVPPLKEEASFPNLPFECRENIDRNLVFWLTNFLYRMEGHSIAK